MDETRIVRFAQALQDPKVRADFVLDACGSDLKLRERVEALLSAVSAYGDETTDFKTEQPTSATGSDILTGAPSTLSAGTESTKGGTVPDSNLKSVDGSTTPETVDSGIDPRATTVEGISRGDLQSIIKRIIGPSDSATDIGSGPPAVTESGSLIGKVIGGRYTLRELLGKGGMGEVYLADQSQPVKRQVALKLIRTGMDSRTVVARFEAERQALAMMDHPNIARVYDGGATESNQPYFVMELVNGSPITTYCDKNRLGVRTRLELFSEVCLAVQHAHQKGIIHRDLKPGNVMVTVVDGRATPKVIDFGVAKATDVRLTDISFSDTGAIVGTPSYMSPEQADPSTMDIDTRTDVYALGVILYELLVGSPPIDAKQFKRGAVLEMLRMVREVEPPRPSTKLRTSNDLSTLAGNRGIEPANLANMMQGELDWIVMKALEKDRNRRYETANGFARDIQRYLSDEVVEARPPSRVYRLKKFVRRHRGQVIAASLLFLSLIGGIVGTSLGLKEANIQKAYAEAGWGKAEENFATARALILSMSSQINRLEDAQKDPRLTQLARRQALDEARGQFTKFLEARPDDEALLSQAILLHRYTANVSRILSDYKVAETAYADAKKVAEQLISQFPNKEEHLLTLGQTIGDRAYLEMLMGRLGEAERSVAEGLQVVERVKSPSLRVDKIRALGLSESERAKLAYLQGRFEDSLLYATRSVELLEQLNREAPQVKQALDSLWSVIAVNRVAVAHRGLGQFGDAMIAHDDAVERMKSIAGPNANRNELYWVCETKLERAVTAAELAEKRVAAEADLLSIKPVAQKLVEDYPQIAFYHEQLASIYLRRGELLGLLDQTEPATTELLKSLATSRILIDRFGNLTNSLLVRGRTFLALSRVRAKAGKYDEAEGHRKNAVKVFEIGLKYDPDNFHLRRGLSDSERPVVLPAK